MPRRVQDIVPANHRSIREVPIEHPVVEKHVSTAKVHKISINKRVSAKQEEDIHSPAPVRHKRAKSGHWILLTLAIIVIVAGIGFIASTYFSRATFTIVPKTVPVTVNGTYVAQHASVAAAQASADTLIYETVTIRKSATSSIEASDGPTISTRAQGKVTVYNAYNGDSQQLIAGTRIANSSGKVYRLTETVTVPGMSTNKTPGKIVVSVVADQTGQIYNILSSDKPDDFVFLGYKGTPRYDGFYARLSTDISGGYEGRKKTVNPAVLASTSAALKMKLAAILDEQAKAFVTEGYITYDSMNTAVYSDAIISSIDSNKAEIAINGVFNGIMFKKSRLASRLAGSQSISTFGKFDFETPGMQELEMSIANPKDFSPEKKTPLLVRGNGNFEIRGIIPSAELKQKLSGVQLADTQEILRNYAPVIQSASGELVPPWAKVPSDPSRISIVIKNK